MPQFSFAPQKIVTNAAAMLSFEHGSCVVSDAGDLLAQAFKGEGDLNEPYTRYVEIQIRVVADQKEGLLFELGKTVLACGFSFVRQRMTESNEGVSLNFAVRGPEAGALELEDRLATQRRVRTYESMMHEVSAPAPPKVATPSRAAVQNLPGHPAPPAGYPAAHAPHSGGR